MGRAGGHEGIDDCLLRRQAILVSILVFLLNGGIHVTPLHSGSTLEFLPLRSHQQHTAG
jgi:hypothetical protein